MLNSAPISQSDRIKAAQALGIHRLSGIRHAALRLALMEQHDKITPDRSRILRIVDRFRVATAFSYYSTRAEMWRS